LGLFQEAKRKIPEAVIDEGGRTRHGTGLRSHWQMGGLYIASRQEAPGRYRREEGRGVQKGSENVW